MALVASAGILGACKREPEVAADAAKPDRRTRCESIGSQVTEMGMALAKGLTVGLSDGKASIDAAQEAKLRTELDVAEAELIAQCMEWPEEALDCFGISAITQSSKCERIIAAAMGEPVLPDDVPAGPTPAWTHELPHDVVDMVGRDDGTVIVLVEPEEAQGDDAPSEHAPPEHAAFVIAVKDGKEVWRRGRAKAPFALESIAGGPLIVVADHEVSGIDAASGDVRWTAKAVESEEDSAEMIAVAQTDEGVVVLDSSGAISRVDPENCTKGKACMKGLMRAEVPQSFATQWLEPGIAGGWIVVAADDGLVHVVDAAGKRRLTLASRTAVSWARAQGDALAVGIDGAVAVLDPAKCGEAGETIAPIVWPPAGKAKWVAESTVREIEVTPTPAGCVRWHAELGVAEDSDAVEMPGDQTWAQSGGFLFAFDAAGKQAVRTAVSANSFVIPSGDGLAVVGDLGSEDVQLVLTWLSATGEHRRRSALPLAEGEMFLVDDVELQVAGPVIVAGLERTLVAFTQ